MDISANTYKLLWIILSSSFILGMFVPLMDADAAHHANIALHMHLNNDYVNLIDRGNDYLDKPHLLFWLSAAAFHVFGVNAFAYKFPSLLFSIAAAFATYKLGTKLYNKAVGKLAAVLLFSSQAFILANMDVKMDALLTANVIIATWQLVCASEDKKWYNYVLAALFMALGFATKGQIGMVVPPLALFFYLICKKDFKKIFHPQWLLVAVLAFVFISPVLYCYYLQFDLHPGKNIRGMTNISGVKFILWGQNTERLAGDNWGGGKYDPTYYLHTFLWAFLPWSIVAYIALAQKIKFLVKRKSISEGLTTGTILFVFILISISRFQLPHYLNVLFPFFAILSSAYLLASKMSDGLLKTHVLLLSIGVAGVLTLSIYAFPLHSIWVAGLAMLILLAGIWSATKHPFSSRLVILCVTLISTANVLLNGSAYPQLLQYQGGDTLAHNMANNHTIDHKEISYYNTHSFTFDFLLQHLHPIVKTDELKHNSYYFTNKAGIDTLTLNGFHPAIVDSSKQFRVSRLNFTFINPATRAGTLDAYYIIKTTGL